MGVGVTMCCGKMLWGDVVGRCCGKMSLEAVVGHHGYASRSRNDFDLR